MRRSEHTARKDHVCDWCGGAINAGDWYVYTFSIWEGEANPWKSHRDCDAFIDRVDYLWDGEGYPPFHDWKSCCLYESLRPEDRAEFDRLWARREAERAARGKGDSE